MEHSGLQKIQDRLVLVFGPLLSSHAGRQIFSHMLDVRFSQGFQFCTWSSVILLHSSTTFNGTCMDITTRKDTRRMYSIFNPFSTVVPFWGETTQILSSLSPKRYCGTNWVKKRRNKNLCVYLFMVWAFFFFKRQYRMSQAGRGPCLPGIRKTGKQPYFGCDLFSFSSPPSIFVSPFSLFFAEPVSRAVCSVVSCFFPGLPFPLPLLDGCSIHPLSWCCSAMVSRQRVEKAVDSTHR